jgi:hypothetical protein
MLELQSQFTTEFLLQFLSRIVMPLATFDNPLPQKNDIPEELNVVSIDGRPSEQPEDEMDGGGKRHPRF